MRRLAAVLLLTLACSRDGSYRDPAGLFRCELPSGWRALERPGSVIFAPPVGRASGGSIGVFRYGPGTLFKTPQDYVAAQRLAAQVGPVSERALRGRTVLEFEAERRGLQLHGTRGPDLREAYALVPFEGGFLAVVHSAPADAYAETEPAYRRLLDTLRL